MNKGTALTIKTRPISEVKEAAFVHNKANTEAPKEKKTPVFTRLKIRKRLQVFIVGAVLMVAIAIGACSYWGIFDFGNSAMGALTAKTVTVNINGTNTEITSRQNTVQMMLNEAGIILSDNDQCDTDLISPLKDGMEINIMKEFTYTITADGKKYQASNIPLTVAEAIDKAGIKLSESDQTSLPLDSTLNGSTDITVYRVWQDTVTEQVAIAPSITRKVDSSLSPGTNKITSEGAEGIQENSVLVTYKDGKEIKREITESKVLQEPGVTVIAYGRLEVASRSGSAHLTNEEAAAQGLKTGTTSNGSSFVYTKAITVQATAYTATGNRTATGTWPSEGTIAVDPSVIPLGTTVYIPGYGYATAEDTGGAIKGKIVDVYFDTKSECINWGRKNLTIYIVD